MSVRHEGLMLRMLDLSCLVSCISLRSWNWLEFQPFQKVCECYVLGFMPTASSSFCCPFLGKELNWWNSRALFGHMPCGAIRRGEILLAIIFSQNLQG